MYFLVATPFSHVSCQVLIYDIGRAPTDLFIIFQFRKALIHLFPGICRVFSKTLFVTEVTSRHESIYTVKIKKLTHELNLR